MSSDQEFVQYVLDQAGLVTHRKMFGEYALYLNEKVVALVCDNQLFVKPTEAGRKFLGEPKEGLPYPGAKPWLLIDEELDDGELVSTLLRLTERELPLPKPKKTKKMHAKKSRARKASAKQPKLPRR